MRLSHDIAWSICEAEKPSQLLHTVLGDIALGTMKATNNMALYGYKSPMTFVQIIHLSLCMRQLPDTANELCFLLQHIFPFLLGPQDQLTLMLHLFLPTQQYGALKLSVNRPQPTLYVPRLTCLKGIQLKLGQTTRLLHFRLMCVEELLKVLTIIMY